MRDCVHLSALILGLRVTEFRTRAAPMAVNPVNPFRIVSAGFASEPSEVVKPFLCEQSNFLRKVGDVTGPRFLLSFQHHTLYVDWPVAANLTGFAK